MQSTMRIISMRAVPVARILAVTYAAFGAVVTIYFNVVAKQMGGIDAKYVSTVDEDQATE